MSEIIKKRSLNYWWRLFATGFSFLVFAVGGALLATGVALIFLLIPSSIFCRKAAMRYVISCAFQVYTHLLKWFGLLTFEVQGQGRLQQQGQLIVANHPSLLDVVFVISLVRNADCIVRNGLWSNPLTAASVKAAGYVRNVPTRLLQLAAESLAEGNSLVVFPEGTRTKLDKPIRFLRGAANIALISKKNITPIVISCKPATLLKHQRWYCIPDRPPHFLIQVLPEVEMNSVVDAEMMQSKAARVLTRYLEHLFKSEISKSEVD